MTLTEKDIAQIAGKGIRPDTVFRQLEAFKKGIPYTIIVAPATTENGMLKLSEEEQQKYVLRYESAKDRLNVLKFVPASGAASRMFAALFQFLKNAAAEKENFISPENKSKIRDFFTSLEKLPFYNEVSQRLLKKHPYINQLDDSAQKQLFVQEMLSGEGCNYGKYPKALLPFHRYKSHTATAFEEHLFEAALYGESRKTARLHFTVMERHLHHFDAEFNAIRDIVAQKTATHFSISFSHQKQHTDTIAVDLNNDPYRKKDGSLLFRPSGHGALLENLNKQQADIIFIKNVDNVVVHTYEKEVAFYKKMLAGKLIALQEKAFEYTRLLETSVPAAIEITTIKQFLSSELCVDIASDFDHRSEEEQLTYLKQKLHRPIRVCGMVKNEGQPGGGPFWVQDDDGRVSLQIVEVAQIDTSDPAQQQLLATATHFNPVDMVCGVKNYTGEKYDLTKFSAPEQGFISQKSEAGTPVKTLELPGLWNGAMAHWHTVFVEVPLTTFNPVKTVNDLLKATHQVE